MKKILITITGVIVIATIVVIVARLGSPPTLESCNSSANIAVEAPKTPEVAPFQTKNAPLYVLSNEEKTACSKYVVPLHEKLRDDPTDQDVEALWKKLSNDFYNETERGYRNIAVFHDGTSNTGDNFSKTTNVWKLYLSAVLNSCEQPIIPYYHKGVGTLMGNRILGQAIGYGIERHIKEDYTFLVENYRKGDKIFIFGFSRGAYIARALNGMIEFVGLLDKDSLKIQNYELPKMVDKLHNFYHQTNDGLPNFNDRLRCHIGHEIEKDKKMQGIAFFTSEKNRLFAEKYQIFQDITLIVPETALHFLVSAIGVYDTVPAVGLSRDDYPDDYRTQLYANEGYHALSLDEQRDDFRPLRFNKSHILLGQQALKEVWFAGDHSDVGGGNTDNADGLEKISRQWMMKQLDRYKLFNYFSEEDIPCRFDAEEYKSHTGDYDPKISVCELDKMHDGLLEAQKTWMDKVYGTAGLHWRKPQPNDMLHKSIICRINQDKLPKPHQAENRAGKIVSREINGLYRPTNLYPCLKKCYRIEDPEYKCFNDNNKMPTMPPYNCHKDNSLYEMLCPGLSPMQGS